MTDDSDPESIAAADALADEFETWYRNLSKSNHPAPRAISGITLDNKQFIVILKDIPWTGPEHTQRRHFIYWLLQKENVQAYVYGSLMASSDGTTAVHIIADDGYNIVQKVMPINPLDNSSFSYELATRDKAKHGEREWHPYTNLMDSKSVDATNINKRDLEFFDNIWADIRSKCLWRNR